MQKQRKKKEKNVTNFKGFEKQPTVLNYIAKFQFVIFDVIITDTGQRKQTLAQLQWRNNSNIKKKNIENLRVKNEN